MADTAEARRGLRAVVRASLDGPAGSGRAKQILLLERPARMRVEVLGWLDQTVAVLATDGERYELFRAGEDSLERGAVHPLLLYQVAGFALAPEHAVQLLLGAPRLGAGWDVARAWRVGESLQLELRDPQHPGSVALRFDADGHLRELVERGAGERPLWEVRFDDYRELPGGEVFAHVVELVDHATEAQARLRFLDVELNPVLEPELFALDRNGRR